MGNIDEKRHGLEVLFWIFENFLVYFHFSILFKNSCLMTKIEQEKCQFTQILEPEIVLFQIKQVCAKISNNNPWPFFVKKSCLASYLYPIYTLIFIKDWITHFFWPKCCLPIVRPKVNKFSIWICFILETFRLQNVGVAAGFL